MIIRKDNSGRTEYVVRGNDGWNLVTNDRGIADRASQGTREFGKTLYIVHHLNLHEI